MPLVNLASLAATLVLASGIASPAPAQLLPHRALYELSLAEPGGGLTAAEGAFAIEWRAACSGYTSQQRLWFLGYTEDGVTFDTDVRFASWESRDTKSLRFSMRSFSAGELVEEYRGSATAGEAGAAGRATYSVPEPLEFALPPGAIFPTKHLQKLLRAADAGERIVTDLLFDGSGAPEDALNEVTAVIGSPVELADEPAGRAWPMALAYHDPADLDGGVPVFELRFQLTANGLMRDVVLDYGDFALTAKLGQMAWLPVPEDCN